MKISQIIENLEELRFTNVAKPTAAVSPKVPKKGQLTDLGTVGQKRAAAQQAINVKNAYQQSVAPQDVPAPQTGTLEKPSSTTPTQPGAGTAKVAPPVDPQAGIGTKIGRGVGAVAKGLGAVAGGAVGAGSAFSQGFDQGRNVVSGKADTTTNRATQQTSPDVRDEIESLKQSLSNLERIVGR